MTVKWGGAVPCAVKVDKQRRELLKLAAAGTAGLITSPWTFQSSRAAPKTIKIGQITPETGPIAAFGEPSKWVAEEVSKFLGDGIVVAGEKHRVEILNRDSQSNPNRASEVAAQLINNDRVDIMIASSTGDTTNPVADQCELAGVPCITSDDPWQSWFFGRKGDPKKGFEWTYHFFWGFDMVANMFAEMWLSIPTNKTAGIMLTNDPDGIAASDPVHGLPATVKSHGFDVHYLGLYPPLSDDFSAQIGQLKSMNADIACGIFNPPQFAIFWTQCAQQGYQPKIVTPPKALLFPTTVEALGDRGAGMSTEVWWSHHHPFKSSLTGISSKDLGGTYEKATGKHWTQPIPYVHALCEVVVDVLKRSKDPKDSKAILEAITTTDVHTIVGHVKWTGQPVKNVCVTPVVAGQWQKHGDRLDIAIVNSGDFPEIKTTSKLLPLA